MQQKIPIVHALGVTKLGSRPASSGESLPVIFDAMSVTLPTDQICAVLGRAGSGRSTFLRLLNGAERPDTGTILTETHFSVISNGGFFFHSGMSCKDNVTLAARLYGINAEMLIELAVGVSRFKDLWELPAGAIPGPRRRAMEMLVAAFLPFDCYLIDDMERVDSDIFELVLQIVRLRSAGLIFTARSPRLVRQFATVCSVIGNQTVYAFPSVDEALEYYAQ